MTMGRLSQDAERNDALSDDTLGNLLRGGDGGLQEHDPSDCLGFADREIMNSPAP
jgi:hypothetical protein